jgi:hypothetical protein
MNSSANVPPIVDRLAIRTCHIHLPNEPKPIGAIAYNGKLYSYVRFYPTLEAAHRASARLSERGNSVVLTKVPKGLVLWVLEQDAWLAQ